jgi:hypothetical protein
MYPISGGRFSVSSPREKKSFSFFFFSFIRKMEARRSFFWNGVLQLNEVGEHSFFDIRVRKTQDNPPQVFVYTSDLPPLPMKSKDDVLKVTFLLENNVGTTTIRYKIADAIFDGKTLEARTANCNQNFISITNDTSEWHFIKQTNWLLYFVSVKIPPEQVKKFMPLL